MMAGDLRGVVSKPGMNNCAKAAHRLRATRLLCLRHANWRGKCWPLRDLQTLPFSNALELGGRAHSNTLAEMPCVY